MRQTRTVAALPWLAFCSLLLAMPAVAETPFPTALVSEAQIPEIFIADATIEAVSQSTIAAETSGRIQQVLFDVGDEVAKGDVLLRFNDKEQKAGLAQAEARLREAEARLLEAKAEYRRVEKVFLKKLVAQSAMDKADTNLKAARQRVKAAKAAVTRAREQLNYTVVRAPYAGVVVERHVEIGEMARPGTPLMTGFSLEHMRASANLPQTVMAAVRKDGRASIYLRDPLAPQQRLSEVQAEKVIVFPYADEKSHSFHVRLQLPRQHVAYYPGMFVKAAFSVGETRQLVVPAKAVVHRSEVTAVYVVDENERISFRQVRVGGTAPGDRLVVLAGLDAGERVSLDPVRAGVMLMEQRAARNAEGEAP